MIASYRIHYQGRTKEGYMLGYIERSDNYLFIAQGYIISYEQWLSITDFEHNIDYNIISMYRHENGNIIILGSDSMTGKNYIVEQPL